MKCKNGEFQENPLSPPDINRMKERFVNNDPKDQEHQRALLAKKKNTGKLLKNILQFHGTIRDLARYKSHLKTS